MFCFRLRTEAVLECLAFVLPQPPQQESRPLVRDADDCFLCTFGLITSIFDVTRVCLSR